MCEGIIRKKEKNQTNRASLLIISCPRWHNSSASTEKFTSKLS